MAGVTLADEEEKQQTHSFSINVAVVSDYRFRGISSSYGDPAVQGGMDYSHAGGFYVGTWGSSVSGTTYLDGGRIEWDVYGGYRRDFGDVTVDVGMLYFFYPSARLPTINPAGNTERYDTLEVYARVTWRWLTLQYWYALTDMLGVQESTYGGACDLSGIDCFGTGQGGSYGSRYVELSVNYPLNNKLSVITHVGHQSVRRYDKLDYTDWKIGLSYDLYGFVLGAAWVNSNADDDWYYAIGRNSTKALGNSTVVLSISRTF